MDIKGILFDKDGTLIEFLDIWTEGYRLFLNTLGIDDKDKNYLLKAAGTNSNGDLIPNSILASGTIMDLAVLTSTVINEDSMLLNEKLDDFFTDYMVSHPEKIVPKCNLVDLFRELKKKDIIIGIVTSDSIAHTKFTIDVLKIGQFVSFISCGDTHMPKPDTSSLKEFCSKFNLKLNEVAMVGDSVADMIYGEEVGLRFGIITNPETEDILKNFTTYTAYNPCEILSILT